MYKLYMPACPKQFVDLLDNVLIFVVVLKRHLYWHRGKHPFSLQLLGYETAKLSNLEQGNEIIGLLKPKCRS